MKDIIEMNQPQKSTMDMFLTWMDERYISMQQLPLATQMSIHMWIAFKNMS